MTYKEIILLLEESSLANPLVRSFYYGDLENLNKQSNIEYARVVLIPTPHEFVNNSLNNYTFTIVFVDRLTNTREKKDIQSEAISTLKEIINRFKAWSEYEEKFSDTPYTVNYSSINVYTDPQRFVDALSGAYMNITVQVKDEEGECFYE